MHNDVSLVFGKGIKAQLKKNIDRKIYSEYETLVFVSEDNLDKFEKIYSNKKINRVHKQVIYNYIEKETILKKAKQEQEVTFDETTINFVTVARLVTQKGIDRLIDIHDKLIKEGFYHEFYVIGEGPEKEKLQEKIKKNEIEKTFHLLGKKENPYPYIKNATYFCLLSYFEGYGMVLEEAKILDKPIIITNTAAREAVKGYPKSKILENTKEGIYEGFKKMIENKEKEEENLAIQKYDNGPIIKQVIELIENGEK